MEAILHAGLPMEIRAVISNRPDAKGLDTAKSAGVATEVVDHKAYPNREEFDRALMQCIDRYQPDFVVLAGFMRILTPGFIEHYPQRIVNIHPSLLPAFPGLHTHRQALAAGAQVHGATVHLVTPVLDHGPILIQAGVPVRADDTEDSLAERVLKEEHRIYPQALRWLAEERISVTGDVVRLDGQDVSHIETLFQVGRDSAQ